VYKTRITDLDAPKQQLRPSWTTLSLQQPFVSDIVSDAYFLFVYLLLPYSAHAVIKRLYIWCI